MLSVLLSACGDATSTVTPATAAATTATATTAAATTAAATTAAATTAAATTAARATTAPAVATTAAPATTKASVASGEFKAPAISGLQETDLGNNTKEFMVEVFGGGKTNTFYQSYVSDKTKDEVVKAAKDAFGTAGYTLFTGPSAVSAGDNSAMLFFTKAGAADAIMMVSVLSDDQSKLSSTMLPGTTPDELEKIMKNTKGKKSVAFMVAGPAIVSEVTGSGSGIGSTKTPTPAAVTTQPAKTGGSGAAVAVEFPKLPEFTDAKPFDMSQDELEQVATILGDPLVEKGKYQAFITKSDAKKVGEFYKDGLKDLYSGRSSSSFTSNNLVTTMLTFSGSKDKSGIRLDVLARTAQDENALNYLFEKYPMLKGKINQGDTLVILAVSKSKF